MFSIQASLVLRSDGCKEKALFHVPKLTPKGNGSNGKVGCAGKGYKPLARKETNRGYSRIREFAFADKWKFTGMLWTNRMG